MIWLVSNKKMYMIRIYSNINYFDIQFSIISPLFVVRSRAYIINKVIRNLALYMSVLHMVVCIHKGNHLTHNIFYQSVCPVLPYFLVLVN